MTDAGSKKEYDGIFATKRDKYAYWCMVLIGLLGIAVMVIVNLTIRTNRLERIIYDRGYREMVNTQELFDNSLSGVVD